jgi:hypothetical protein
MEKKYLQIFDEESLGKEPYVGPKGNLFHGAGFFLRS